jgi:xanthine dehydrogenase accessory factor
MKIVNIAALALASAQRQPVAFAKRLTDATEFLLPDPSAPDELNRAGTAALAADQTGTETIAGEPWFIEARNPQPRLMIIGAVHIAQALSTLAVMTGFSVIVIDPRQNFGSESRFPGIQVSNEWPDIALTSQRPDFSTAIVALSHDPKLDDPALDKALKSDAFYVGALGSRKSHANRLERLRALNHDDTALARIHGPVGLYIGARTAPEIALSIMTEIIAVRRQRGLVPRTR